MKCLWLVDSVCVLFLQLSGSTRPVYGSFSTPIVQSLGECSVFLIWLLWGFRFYFRVLHFQGFWTRPFDARSHILLALFLPLVPAELCERFIRGFSIVLGVLLWNSPEVFSYGGDYCYNMTSADKVLDLGSWMIGLQPLAVVLHVVSGEDRSFFSSGLQISLLNAWSS